eukprot:TRINITY_DN8185_c0_g1_i1.p1 TRINITY_DN8185_c0_g1~~TRINITY_DN8185_c0_g1_i1.p1  ORF type:complete len:244 (+),score=74.15 TRINITY_DN8185_c0_g1_i1:88-819(+)
MCIRDRTYAFVREKYLEVFDRFDSNQDGTFQKSELNNLAKVFAHIGGNAEPTEDDIAQGVPELIELFDSNGDQQIDREEFADAYMKISGFTGPEEFDSTLTEKQFFDSVSAQFPLLFIDSKNGIPLTFEFVREQYAKAFDRFDENKDGEFQKEELQKISIEFAKLGGKKVEDPADILEAVEQTRNLFDIDGDQVVTRDEFADRYMEISGFTDPDTFHSPVTQEQFMASMRFSCPLLFADEESA